MPIPFTQKRLVFLGIVFAMFEGMEFNCIVSICENWKFFVEQYINDKYGMISSLFPKCSILGIPHLHIISTCNFFFKYHTGFLWSYYLFALQYIGRLKILNVCNSSNIVFKSISHAFFKKKGLNGHPSYSSKDLL